MGCLVVQLGVLRFPVQRKHGRQAAQLHLAMLEQIEAGVQRDRRTHRLEAGQRVVSLHGIVDLYAVFGVHLEEMCVNFLSVISKFMRFPKNIMHQILNQIMDICICYHRKST